MKTLLIVSSCVAAVAATILITGSHRAIAASGLSGIPVGKSCTVQFRRDALGAANSVPIGPMTGSINGAETSVSGTLKTIMDEWIILDRGGKNIWVPKTVVLSLQF